MKYWMVEYESGWEEVRIGRHVEEVIAEAAEAYQFKHRVTWCREMSKHEVDERRARLEDLRRI